MGLLWLLLYGGLSALGLGSLLIAVELLRPRRRTFASALAKNLPTDPGQLGWTFEETQFILSDGSNTPGWMIQGQKADGPVVVVCHGWGEGRYDVLPRLHPVVALASHIVVYDQRGHGESEAKLSRLGTWEVHDLRCVVDQVRERLGTHQPIVLLGYSMGAGVVIQFAAGLQDRSGHQGNQPIINAVVVEGACPKLSIALAGILRTLHFPPYPMAWIAPWLVLPWALGVAWMDHRTIIRKLHCPLLVLHGKLDPIAPIRHAQTLAQYAQQGTFIEFPEGGHLGLAEVERQRYFDALKTVMQPAL